MDIYLPLPLLDQVLLVSEVEVVKRCEPEHYGRYRERQQGLFPYIDQVTFDLPNLTRSLGMAGAPPLAPDDLMRVLARGDVSVQLVALESQHPLPQHILAGFANNRLWGLSIKTPEAMSLVCPEWGRERGHH